MFPGLHVDAHTCGDGLHPRAGSTPSPRLHRLLLWSEAGSGAQVNSIPFKYAQSSWQWLPPSYGKQEMLEQEPYGAGGHVQVVLQAGQNREAIFDIDSTVFPRGSKILGFLHIPLVNLSGLQTN